MEHTTIADPSQELPSQTTTKTTITRQASDKSTLSRSTYNVIIILFSITTVICILGFSVVMAIIVIKDGNSPLVDDMAGKMTTMVVTGFLTVLGMVSGPELLAQVMNRNKGE